MNFKKWVKSIQTAGYNGACTVYKQKFIFQSVKKLTRINLALSENSTYPIMLYVSQYVLHPHIYISHFQLQRVFWKWQKDELWLRSRNGWLDLWFLAVCFFALAISLCSSVTQLRCCTQLQFYWMILYNFRAVAYIINFLYQKITFYIR